ncbi:glutathione synthase [Pedococcus dokdonensis]|uniref:Glutathione synthetase n=1 Tax=Pedococcus dokdonensis TaxID=443156 RepID=A0A1H0TY24_9MICO|nr:glutathione synthase [Pedococcus dokdonensis]SDP58834.1 glutathione synthase [Pedococcus dokdonensis]
MRTLFVVDPLDGLDASLDTSIGLMHAAQDLGVQVWVTEARDLEVVDGRAVARARSLRLAPSVPADGCRWTVPDPWYAAGPSERVRIDDMAAVFLRIEPPVDGDYLAATHVLDLVGRDADRNDDSDRTTAMVNAPAGLRACSEHLLGLGFPDLTPPTVVTASADTVADFLHEHGRIVVKPVDGFSGRGVFLLSRHDPNLATVVESSTLAGRRQVVAQPYLPEVEAGNKRIYVLDGVAVGASLRHPVPGDFRIVSPDGPADLTARDHEIVDRLAPTLEAHGLRCVGLDVIDGHLIEVNVTSPGALRKADALLGTTYCADLVSHVLTHTTWKAPS